MKKKTNPQKETQQKTEKQLQSVCTNSKDNMRWISADMKLHYSLHVQHKSISKHKHKKISSVCTLLSFLASGEHSPIAVQEILLPSKNLAGYCIILE